MSQDVFTLEGTICEKRDPALLRPMLSCFFVMLFGLGPLQAFIRIDKQSACDMKGTVTLYSPNQRRNVSGCTQRRNLYLSLSLFLYKYIHTHIYTPQFPFGAVNDSSDTILQFQSRYGRIWLAWCTFLLVFFEEMKPYVLLAERLGYVVNVVEPWEICAKQLGWTRLKAFLQKAFLVGHLLYMVKSSVFFFVVAKLGLRRVIFVKSCLYLMNHTINCQVQLMNQILGINRRLYF